MFSKAKIKDPNTLTQTDVKNCVYVDLFFKGRALLELVVLRVLTL